MSNIATVLGPDNRPTRLALVTIQVGNLEVALRFFRELFVVEVLHTLLQNSDSQRAHAILSISGQPVVLILDTEAMALPFTSLPIVVFGVEDPGKVGQEVLNFSGLFELERTPRGLLVIATDLIANGILLVEYTDQPVASA